MTADRFPSDLFRQLADGGVHAGPVLAESLGLTRAAVWKQVERLRGFGLDVEAVSGRGYRLADPPALLDPDAIVAALPDDVSPPRLELYDTLGSTNAHLMADRDAPSGAVCLAEHQSGGRGRRGRVWQSPFGAGVWLSMVWRFESMGTAAGGLALAVGAAAADALREAGVAGIRLKWPNDLLVERAGDWAKLGGVLVEIAGEAGGHARAVAGIGVNHRLPDGFASEQSVTDVMSSSGRAPDRTSVAAALVTALTRGFRTFETEGLAPALDRWRSLDMLAGRSVRVLDGERTREGIARGIAEDGSLQVEMPEGTVTLRAGEVSLRTEGGPCAS